MPFCHGQMVQFREWAGLGMKGVVLVRDREGGVGCRLSVVGWWGANVTRDGRLLRGRDAMHCVSTRMKKAGEELGHMGFLVLRILCIFPSLPLPRPLEGRATRENAKVLCFNSSTPGTTRAGGQKDQRNRKTFPKSFAFFLPRRPSNSLPAIVAGRPKRGEPAHPRKMQRCGVRYSKEGHPFANRIWQNQRNL